MLQSGSNGFREISEFTEIEYDKLTLNIKTEFDIQRTVHRDTFL